MTALSVISLNDEMERKRFSTKIVCVCLCVCLEEAEEEGSRFFGDYAKSGPVRRGGGAEGQTKTEEDAATGI